MERFPIPIFIPARIADAIMPFVCIPALVILVALAFMPFGLAAGAGVAGFAVGLYIWMILVGLFVIVLQSTTEFRGDA